MAKIPHLTDLERRNELDVLEGWHEVECSDFSKFVCERLVKQRQIGHIVDTQREV